MRVTINIAGISCLLLAMSPLLALSQGRITGIVKDQKTGEPLQFASVFLNNTSLGAPTDEAGHFVISSCPAGNYELKVSYVGYETFSKQIEVEDRSTFNLNVSLRTGKMSLPDLEVKGTRDKKWEKSYKRFEREFLGGTSNATKCEVLNPWVVNFEGPDEGLAKTWDLKATGEAPLEIMNKALGYKVYFYILQFELYSNKLIMLGDTRFERLKPQGEKEEKHWIRNRLDSYLGSERHLFSSLIAGTLEQEGFHLYSELQPTKELVRSNIFGAELGKTVVPYSIRVLPAPGKKKLYRIPIDGRIEIHFKRGGNVSFYKDTSDEISWVETTDNFIVTDPQGILQDPGKVVTFGHLRYLRLADMLPLDYQRGQ